MKYYFTDWSGERESEGEHPKHWFDIDDPDVFTNKKDRDKARRARLKGYIAELKQTLKEVGK